MADIALTAVQVRPIDVSKCETHTFLAASTITQGMPVYLLTAGTVAAADANGSAPLPQFLGIALNGGGTGQAIEVLKRGKVAGFTVSGMNAGAKVYLSSTVGVLADAATGTLAPVGMVVTMPDSTPTKVVYIDANWSVLYA